MVNDSSFLMMARTFYNNSECNSEKEFINDINKIDLIGTLLKRIVLRETTNYHLLLNHFLSFVNCFGFMSEKLLNHKLPEHYKKINALFVFIGSKQFDGTFEIDEEFFIQLRKTK